MFILEHKISERRACSLIGMSRSQFRYTSQKKEDAEVLRAIIKIKARHKYYGVPRVLATLRRDGFIVNGKRVYRILKNLNQMVDQKKKRKNRFIPPSAKTPDAIGPNEVWSMDFVFDRLADGTPFRCYTIVDNYTREVPGILASKSMAGFSPVKYLEGLKSKRHLPKHFILDNGSEFANSVFVSWCQKNKISLHFIDPGKPVQNAYIESFNGKFRLEFLDQHRFKAISEVRSKLEEWVRFYNEERPHSSLDYLTPKEFAKNEMSVIDQKNNLLVLKTG